MTQKEMQAFDAVFVSGGDCAVLCREMVRTGFNKVLLTAVNSGLFYVGISAGSMYAAGIWRTVCMSLKTPSFPIGKRAVGGNARGQRSRLPGGRTGCLRDRG